MKGIGYDYIANAGNEVNLLRYRELLFLIDKFLDEGLNDNIEIIYTRREKYIEDSKLINVQADRKKSGASLDVDVDCMDVVYALRDFYQKKLSEQQDEKQTN